MKKEPTPKQLAARKAFGDAAKARSLASKQAAQINPLLPTEEVPTDTQGSPDLSAMQKQLDEVMETNALLKAALLGNLNNQNQGQTANLGRNGIVGEVDKYLVDPENYPDPTPRLAAEPRLQTIAFNHNYELQYEFSVRPYETKTGINYREPEFLITLLRVVLDDQGNRIQVVNPRNGNLEDKFYIARRLIFHEDPQAALVIARDNNILVEKADEKVFLDEMRYLRVRDWLFGFLWPKVADAKAQVMEEAVGGTIVQVFTKSSVEPSEIDFDSLKLKV